MSFLQLAYSIARRRIAAAWQLELVLFLGILLSVAILSGSVVFSDLLAEAALRRALQEAPAEEVNFWVRIYHHLEEPATAARRDSVYQSAVDFVEERVNRPFRPYLEGEARLLETATFFFGGAARFDLPNETRPRGRVQYMTGLLGEKRSQLVAGRWPGEAAANAGMAAAPVLEVAIDTSGAEMLRLMVGEELDLLPTSGTLNQQVTRARIVGVFSRVNPGDDFWHGRERNFSHHNDQWATVPLFTTEAAILEQMAATYPGLYANATWIFDLNRQGVRAGDTAALKTALRRTRNDIAANLENSTVDIKLERLLDRYSEQLTLSRIPLFLMVFLVVGILAYYLTLVSGLTVRARSGEIALLKSRGATTGQVGLLILVEGLVLAVPAVAVGTLLAPPAAGLLGGLFFDLEVDGGLISLSYRAFLLGAGGALLAVLVLTLSTLAAARQSIVEFRQAGARPPQRPWFHRYYLDLLLLVLIGLLWWQIQSRDTFLLRPAGAGELEIDFTLLLSPALGLVALGLLTLRFFPLAMALLARIAEPVGPVWLVQGLRRVGRDPIAPGSLVALLMLATALGVIGSAFTATLQRSQADQARYQGGADLRIKHSGDRNPVVDYGLAELAAASWQLQGVAEGQRGSGALLTQGISSTRLSVLAVDAANFADAAWFRADFAGGQSLGELMEVLKPEAGKAAEDYGIELPREASGLAVWANPGRPGARLVVLARLRDSRGYHFDIFLGEPTALGWQRLSGELTPVRRRGNAPPPEVRPPFTLLNLQVGSRFGLNEPGILFLDELAAVTPGGERVMADLQSLENWAVIEDYARPGLYALETSAAVARAEGRVAAAFSWAPGGIGLRGIRPGPADAAVPVIVSPEVLEIGDAGIGDMLTLSVANFALPVRVAAVADYFPTLDPREQPFIVMDGAAFAGYANRHGRRVAGGPDEVWAALVDGADGAAALSALATALADRGLEVGESRQAAAEIRRRVARPLANASWGGLLALMFLALTLASASGVALFSYVDTGERRTEFALLRTMGSSARQLNGMVWFNLLLIVVCGVGLGTWAGQQIGAALLPVLEVAEGGMRVTPPMVLQTNGLTLLTAYLALAAVAVGNGIWLAWFTARLEVQQVLRAGEGVQG